jgi:hypothetical protein
VALFKDEALARVACDSTHRAHDGRVGRRRSSGASLGARARAQQRRRPAAHVRREHTHLLSQRRPRCL